MPKLRVDDGDEFALEIATRLSKSVALRLVLGLVNSPLQALEVVMEGSVAQALSKRGRRLSVFLGLGEDSLRGTTSGEYLAVAIPDAGMFDGLSDRKRCCWVAILEAKKFAISSGDFDENNASWRSKALPYMNGSLRRLRQYAVRQKGR